MIESEGISVSLRAVFKSVYLVAGMSEPSQGVRFSDRFERLLDRSHHGVLRPRRAPYGNLLLPRRRAALDHHASLGIGEKLTQSADQLAKARRAAGSEGLAIQFDEGDCQQLPYADAAFGAVVSAFGAIFAPDHERTAAELARVCRPAGRLGLTAWPADEWTQVHARAGRTSIEDADAREWSKEEHVRALLGDAFELELQTGNWRVEAGSEEELWELASSSMPIPGDWRRSPMVSRATAGSRP